MASKPSRGNSAKGKTDMKNTSKKSVSPDTKKKTAFDKEKNKATDLPAPKESAWKPDGYFSRYPEIKIIMALLVCVLFMLCNIHLCGIVGNWIFVLIHGLFGCLAYVLPFFWFLGYAFLIANKGSREAKSKLFAALMISWILCAFAHLIGIDKATGYNWILYFENGQTGINGGLTGGILGGALQQLFGNVAATICLVALLLIFIILFTERSISSMFVDMWNSVFDRNRDLEETVAEDIGFEERRNLPNSPQTSEEGGLMQVPKGYPHKNNARSLNRFISDKLHFPREKKEPVQEMKPAREARPVMEDKPYIANGMNGYTGTRSQRILLDRELSSLEDMGFRFEDKEQGYGFGYHKDASVSIDDFILYNGIREWDDARPFVMPDPAQPVQPVIDPKQEDAVSLEEQEDSVLVPAATWKSDRTGEVIAASSWQSDQEFEEPEYQDADKSDFYEDGGDIEEDNEDQEVFVFPVESSGSQEYEDAVDLTEDIELPEDQPVSGKSVKDINIWKDPSSSGTRGDSGGVSFSGPVKQPEKPAFIKTPYKAPPLNKLKRNGEFRLQIGESQRSIQQKLQETLKSFGVNVRMGNISVGPAVTRYELEPETGVKVSRIVSLQDDIKLALAASDIRIEAPIPGKSAVGIEVPNKDNTIVGFRELIDTERFRNHPSKLCVAIGRDLAGQVQIADLAKMPHLLIAGATGSGKSVCINTLIMSILYKAKPEEVKLIMVDPKVVELSAYNGIPHLLIPVVTDPRKASNALRWACEEMDSRYEKLARFKVRNIQGYNEEIKKRKDIEPGFEEEPMSQIVIIVDELADLMMVAPGEVEEAICRLAQKARAAGIHLVLATQRPSVNVITGLIKANVPSRIAFAVSSGVDSRTILDMNGAEKLLGKGDMLYYPYGLQKPIRVQGAFISDEEVSEVVEYIVKHNSGKSGEEQMEEMITSASGPRQIMSDQDEHFADAARFIIEKDKASIGALQRQFKIGFNRAARLMDALADAGIVGEEEGTKPRKILMNLEELEAFLKNQ